MKAKDPKVGVMIPTKNRSEYVIRLLEYYAKLKSPHPIYINDASGTEHNRALFSVVKRLSDQIEIHYVNNRSLNDRQAIGSLIESVKEPYSAFVGDDDFLIPAGLSQCALFLESNPDYRVVRGVSRKFNLTQPGAYGRVARIGPYSNESQREEDSPVERIQKFGANYWPTFFCTHRAHEFLQDWEGNNQNPNRSFGELMPSFLNIVRGKAKYLDCLYLVRQMHDRRYLLPQTIYQLIREPSWNKALNLFIDKVSGALIQQGFAKNEAQLQAEKAYESYFEQAIYSRMGNSTSPNIRQKYIRLKKHIKGISHPLLWNTGRFFYRKLKKTTRGEPANNVLKSDSPYYMDFKPIVEILEGPR
jgi:glycosyltransferase domain-containing protein